MRRGETLAAAGQIAVGLAHEIRNPLGAIRGAVQLMAREMGELPRSRCLELSHRRRAADARGRQPAG